MNFVPAEFGIGKLVLNGFLVEIKENEKGKYILADDVMLCWLYRDGSNYRVDLDIISRFIEETPSK